jgi:peptidoglycan/xylan/chitin deacetylase (PgdA/CDA1 family)
MYVKIKKKLKKILAENFVQKSFLLRDDTSLVSITFDDFPKSAAINASRILEAYNFNGTFYASFGLIGTEGFANASDIVALNKAGHEVGCHTFSHLSCGLTKASLVDIDCEKNRRTALEICDVSLASFAYPFGEFSPSSKKVIKKHYKAARTVKSGINRGVIDLAGLFAVPLYESTSLNFIESCIDEVNLKGGWLIFYTHDVCSNPSLYGVTEDKFERVISHVFSKGVKVLSVGEVIDGFNCEV